MRNMPSSSRRPLPSTNVIIVSMWKIPRFPWPLRRLRVDGHGADPELRRRVAQVDPDIAFADRPLQTVPLQERVRTGAPEQPDERLSRYEPRCANGKFNFDPRSFRKILAADTGHPAGGLFGGVVLGRWQ